MIRTPTVLRISIGASALDAMVRIEILEGFEFLSAYGWRRDTVVLYKEIMLYTCMSWRYALYTSTVTERVVRMRVHLGEGDTIAKLYTRPRPHR